MALYSPDTAVISPLEILESLKEELIKSGNVEILARHLLCRIKWKPHGSYFGGQYKFPKIC